MIFNCHWILVKQFKRGLSMELARKGLVLGFFEGQKEGEVVLTKVAESLQSLKVPKLNELLQLSGLNHKKGKCRLFCGLDNEWTNIVLTNLGKHGAGVNQLEEIDEGREGIRTGVSAAVKLLQDSGVKTVYVDPCGNSEAAAEGAFLSSWCFDEFKAEDKRKTLLDIHCYDQKEFPSWERGKILAEAQNFARYLMENPANKMTPTRFAQVVSDKFANLKNVAVYIRDKAWALEKKMGAFLSVAQGSEEPPIFLEVHYKGTNGVPLALVGKGVTFDSGGISIKPSASMDEMRADMGGAACVVSSIYAAATLNLPIHIIGFTPLTENMPSGKATKPGDVHTAMNGKTIQIDNTDAEGRLILSDALCYSQTFNPCAIVDLATLTGAIMIALGASAAGVYTNSSSLWNQMHQAGIKSGDRVWRMPLFKFYTKQVTESLLADVNNISNAGRMGGSCTAAAFLREFVTNDHWMHMDIAGVMTNSSQVPYLGKGMSGRPTRTLIEFLTNFENPTK